MGYWRRGGMGGGRRGDGDDLDRQGDRAGLDAGADQTVCGNVLPGARPRSGVPAWRPTADAPDLRAIWQCAGLERIRGTEVQGTDRGGGGGDGHASPYGQVFY